MVTYVYAMGCVIATISIAMSRVLFYEAGGHTGASGALFWAGLLAFWLGAATPDDRLIK